jgi:hypothetical protein
MTATTLEHIEKILAEPAPTVPELPEDPSREELCAQYVSMARAYASEVLLNRQAMLAFVHHMKRLTAKVEALSQNGSRP